MWIYVDLFIFYFLCSYFSVLRSLSIRGLLCCCFTCILQSAGGSGLSAQIGALQQSWRANAPADFARTDLCVGAVACSQISPVATTRNNAQERRKVGRRLTSKKPGRTL